LKAALLLACAAVSGGSFAESGGEPDTLGALQNLSSLRNASVKTSSSVDPGSLRAESMRETAETLGFQSAVKWRYDRINAELEAMAAELDGIYDFAPLMMHDGRMRPPVVVEANNTETLNSDVESTASDTTWEIRDDAKVVISPPSWRDYLVQHYAVNDEVNPLIRPKDSEEGKQWAADVKKGWDAGIAQADSLFEINLNRLARDFRGIVRFHRLAEQNVLAVPDFAVGDLGVTVNGRKMDVNQRLFQITGHAKFNADPARWKALR
jgi:defect-in-organelle-trafficking protein DotC